MVDAPAGQLRQKTAQHVELIRRIGRGHGDDGIGIAAGQPVLLSPLFRRVATIPQLGGFAISPNTVNSSGRHGKPRLKFLSIELTKIWGPGPGFGAQDANIISVTIAWGVG